MPLNVGRSLREGSEAALAGFQAQAAGRQLKDQDVFRQTSMRAQAENPEGNYVVGEHARWLEQAGMPDVAQKLRDIESNNIKSKAEEAKAKIDVLKASIPMVKALAPTNPEVWGRFAELIEQAGFAQGIPRAWDEDSAAMLNQMEKNLGLITSMGPFQEIPGSAYSGQRDPKSGEYKNVKPTSPGGSSGGYTFGQQLDDANRQIANSFGGTYNPITQQFSALDKEAAAQANEAAVRVNEMARANPGMSGYAIAAQVLQGMAGAQNQPNQPAQNNDPLNLR